MNLLERGIEKVFPGWALRRTEARLNLVHARATLSQIETFTNGAGGYQSGKHNRLTKGWISGGIHTENQIPREQVANLRSRAWDLYRNNPNAKKIVRSITAKVVGKGLRPQSQAIRNDGTAHVEFRERALAIWDAVKDKLDYRGRPSQGGLTDTDRQQQALRHCILSGDTFTSTLPIDTALMRARELPVPINVQLIHRDRLDETLDLYQDSTVYRGIELDQRGLRVAYHFFDNDPAQTFAVMQNSRRVKASQIGHLYVAEDIDQMLGVSWFASVILRARNTDDYEYNELKASAMAACIVLGYRRSTGQSQFGANMPTDWDLTDSDGNKLTGLQPGMFLDLGMNGDLVGFNPQRPNSNVSEFVGHMLRGTANGVPGVKGSTLTQDYRNSSFSSEKSADNDVWPEIEAVQSWFAHGHCQPIYEAVITAAVAEGLFAGVVTPAEFARRRAEYLRSEWQGPVARQINEVDDAEAAKERVRNGQSSPQREAAKVGNNWREIIREDAEFIEYAKSQQLPDDITLQMLGIEQQDQPPEGAEEKTSGNQATKRFALPELLGSRQ